MIGLDELLVTFFGGQLMSVTTLTRPHGSHSLKTNRMSRYFERSSEPVGGEEVGEPNPTYEKRRIRQQFQHFLAHHRHLAETATLDELVEQSQIPISKSAAYRVAFFLRVKGERRNQSRYDEFWAKINWGLPDSDIADIWEVDRGNVQSKRRFLAVTQPEIARPKWSRLSPSVPAYKEALRMERNKASKYDRNRLRRPA